MEKIAHRAEEIEFRQVGRIENVGNQGATTNNGIMGGIMEFPTLIHKNVYEVLTLNPKTKIAALADNVGVSVRSVARIIADLKAMDLITRQGGNRHGEWIVKKVK